MIFKLIVMGRSKRGQMEECNPDSKEYKPEIDHREHPSAAVIEPISDFGHSMTI